jgi:hypothetical protein
MDQLTEFSQPPHVEAEGVVTARVTESVQWQAPPTAPQNPIWMGAQHVPSLPAGGGGYADSYAWPALFAARPTRTTEYHITDNNGVTTDVLPTAPLPESVTRVYVDDDNTEDMLERWDKQGLRAVGTTVASLQVWHKSQYWQAVDGKYDSVHFVEGRHAASEWNAMQYTIAQQRTVEDS